MLPYATEAEVAKINKLFFPHYKRNIFELANHKIKDFGFNPKYVKALIFNA
jgi:hypothetical protein